MQAHIDHVVLWVADPIRSVEFYEHVVGFPGLRVDAFKAGEAPFPSVRLSERTILDLMDRAVAPAIGAMHGAESSAGHPVNHVCFTLAKHDYDALRARLQEHAVAMPLTLQDSFGAQGLAPEAFYFLDPDGNVLEARYYEG